MIEVELEEEVEGGEVVAVVGVGTAKHVLFNSCQSKAFHL